jgi:hypothetical protein
MTDFGYYQRESALADAGGEFANLSTGGNLSVETMLGLTRTSHRFDPIGVYVPWGKQVQGGGWETIDAPDHDVLLYPITDADVRQVNSQSYGYELPWIGVLTERPVPPKVADEVFDPTRYDLFESEGVYDADDGRPSPRISFLYWAKLHDDVGGGRGSLDTVASQLGGKLVFPMHLPLKEPRSAPPLPFRMVLQTQLMPPSAVGDAVLAPQAPAPSQVTGVQYGLWAAVTAATGYVFWRTIRPRPAKRKRR